MVGDVVAAIIVGLSSVLLVYWFVQACRLIFTGRSPQRRRSAQSERGSRREWRRKRA